MSHLYKNLWKEKSVIGGWMKARGPGPVRWCGQTAERRPWDAMGGRGEGQESPDPHDGLNAGGERTQVSHLGTWCAVHHDGDGRGQQFLGELGRIPWGHDSSSWRPAPAALCVLWSRRQSPRKGWCTAVPTSHAACTQRFTPLFLGLKKTTNWSILVKK